MAEIDGLVDGGVETGSGERVTMKTITKRRTDVIWLDLNDTEEIPGFNVRDHDDEYEAHIAYLMGRIVAMDGVENPLRGYFDKDTGKFKITRGYSRRLALVRLAAEGKIFPVPTLPEKATDPAEMIAVQIRDNGGKPLKTFERAEIFKRLNLAGWSTQRIADENPTAITRQQVENVIALADVTPAIKNMVIGDVISATTAAQEMKAAKAANPNDLNDAALSCESVLLELVRLAGEQGTKPTAENAKIVREAFATPAPVEPAPQEGLFDDDKPAETTSTPVTQPVASAVPAVQGTGMATASTAPKAESKAAKPAKEKKAPALKKAAGKGGKAADKSKGYDGHSAETVEQALALLTVMRQIMPDCTVGDLLASSSDSGEIQPDRVNIIMRKSDYTQMMGFIE